MIYFNKILNKILNKIYLMNTLDAALENNNWCQ